jgi:hypothetical protein
MVCGLQLTDYPCNAASDVGSLWLTMRNRSLGEGGAVSCTPSLAGVSFLSRSFVITGPNWA